MFEIIKSAVTIIVVVILAFVVGTLTEPEPQEEAPIPAETTPKEIELKVVEKEVKTDKSIVEEREEIKTKETAAKEPVEIEVTITEGEEVIEINSAGFDPGPIDLIVTILPTKETAPSVSEVNTTTRDALVNILCTSKQGGLLQPITGSGVIIDPRGVVLTNAHIAQYYLLKDYIVKDFLECNIRTGSPAVNTYKAELLYISPSWVQDNYQKIALQSPKGTGEDDLALLLINESTRVGVKLPNSFPHVSPDTRDGKPEVGESVVVAGYPAGFLGGSSIQKDLYAVSTVTQVMDVFTFKENTLDLFSIGGNIAAQKGSSGGAVVNFKGGLSGVVVTASDATQTEDRDLRAITLSHVDKSIKKDTGASLGSYLFGDLTQKAAQFRALFVPELTTLLEGALTN